MNFSNRIVKRKLFLSIIAGAGYFTHGCVWRQDGTLAMSISQEGVICGTLCLILKPTRSIHNIEISTNSNEASKSKL